jgi:hypothetical protein
VTKPVNPTEGSGRTRVRRLLPVAAAVLAVTGPVDRHQPDVHAGEALLDDVLRHRSRRDVADADQREPVAGPNGCGRPGRLLLAFRQVRGR